RPGPAWRCASAPPPFFRPSFNLSAFRVPCCGLVGMVSPGFRLQRPIRCGVPQCGQKPRWNPACWCALLLQRARETGETGEFAMPDDFGNGDFRGKPDKSADKLKFATARDVQGGAYDV